MRDFPVLEAHPPAPARPVSAFFTATVLASALAALGCGAIILAAEVHHHARPQVAVHPEWFAPPVTIAGGMTRLEQGDGR